MKATERQSIDTAPRAPQPILGGDIVGTWPDSRSSAYDRVKRVADVMVALLSLALLGPVLLVMAALIKLTSRGPVFYRGTVIGRFGKSFTYYKFRTMVVDGDSTAHQRFIQAYVAGDPPSGRQGEQGGEGEKPVYKLLDDPRITTVGRWLRRTSLDEMAQMINVLRDEMSIVGPRPPVPYEYAHYNDYHKRRLDVLPGITGLAQVRARSRASFEEMVAIDMEYIRRRSLAFDLAIMVETVWVMISGRGAH